MAYWLLKSRLGLVATAALVSGCFTSPVNMRPIVSIDSPTAGVFRGESATFTATALDPDGPTPSVDWEWVVGPCSTNATDPATWRQDMSSTASSFDVPAEATQSTFCVKARVQDSHLATAIATKNITPGDRAPKAEIKMSTPMLDPTMPLPGSFPVHTQFVLFESSMNDDPMNTLGLKFTWSLKIDTVASSDPLTCEGDLEHRQACFTAAAPGSYDVELDVTAGAETTVIHFPFLVLAGTPPVAHLDIITPAPYELGRPIELSAMRSMPEAGLTTFTILHDGNTIDTGPCVGATSDRTVCFTPPTPGSYTAKLDVTSDGVSSSDSPPPLTVMKDRLPCMGVTDPPRGQAEPDPLLRLPLSNPLDQYPFAIKSVDDDLDGGDPTALDPSYFEWLVSVDGKPFTFLANGPTLLIPQHEYRIGTPVGLRLQIRDRNLDGGNAHFATCVDPKCYTTDGCLQRWTWTVTFQ